MAYITPADLEPFADIDTDKAVAMIDDAVAQAILVAPCLAVEGDLDANQLAAVKSVLRGAVLRWHDAGTGAFNQQTAGPFSVSYDNRTVRRSLFWPSEIDQLQTVCAAVNGDGSGKAYSVDTAPDPGVLLTPFAPGGHLDWT